MVQDATLIVDTVAALMLTAAVKDSASIGCVERMLRDRRTKMFMRTMSRDKWNHACYLGCQE